MYSQLVVSLRSTAGGWVWYETSYVHTHTHSGLIVGTKKSIILSDLRYLKALGLTW